MQIYELAWKFSGLVCEFVVNISNNSCISECISIKYLAVNLVSDVAIFVLKRDVKLQLNLR